MDHMNDTVEQRLTGLEARLTALAEETRKLDRLIYKLFIGNSRSGETAERR